MGGKRKKSIGTIPIRNGVKFRLLEVSFPREDTVHPLQPCVQGHLLAEQPELALPLAECKKPGFAQKTVGFSDSRRFWRI